MDLPAAARRPDAPAAAAPVADAQVEEALAESFPASDPPAWGPLRAGAPGDRARAAPDAAAADRTSLPGAATGTGMNVLPSAPALFTLRPDLLLVQHADPAGSAAEGLVTNAYGLVGAGGATVWVDAAFPALLPALRRAAADGGTLLVGDAAMGTTADQHAAGLERLIRPPAAFSADDAALRRRWERLRLAVATVGVYHGTVYVGRAADMPTLMRPLTRDEPTRGMRG